MRQIAARLGLLLKQMTDWHEWTTLLEHRMGPLTRPAYSSCQPPPNDATQANPSTLVHCGLQNYAVICRSSLQSAAILTGLRTVSYACAIKSSGSSAFSVDVKSAVEEVGAG